MVWRMVAFGREPLRACVTVAPGHEQRGDIVSPAGGLLRLPGGFGSLFEYVTTRGNQETMLAFQIETAGALECVEGICAVPGVDVAFIGPGDLATDMGLVNKYGMPGCWGSDEFKAAGIRTCTARTARVCASDTCFLHKHSACACCAQMLPVPRPLPPPLPGLCVCLCRAGRGEAHRRRVQGQQQGGQPTTSNNNRQHSTATTTTTTATATAIA